MSSSQPQNIPPIWAKCATLSILPDTPKNSSSSPYIITNHLAFIGIGGISSMIVALGCSMPNASNKPNTAPEAPTVGVQRYCW